jgi:hypothetical protein
MIGAVAEFMRTTVEATIGDDTTTVITARGGLRIDATSDTRVVRFSLANGLACTALCLTESRARLSGSATLREIGCDDGALRDADRAALMFDLGIASPYFDFCIRTADPAAARVLRTMAGRPLFGDSRGLLAEIAAMQPHRIAVSQLGRIEVYQPIADAGGATPDGPHTHLLPELLAARLSFDPDEPIPAGWIPCAHMYLGALPAHDHGAATT